MIISDIEEPIVKGSNRTLRFTVTDSVGAVNLSSAELILSVKKYLADSSYAFQRKNAAAGGGTSEIDFTTDGTDGKFEVKIIPANTSSLDAGVYFYDCEYTIGSSVERKPWEQFILKEAVT